jgi:hypothetical protein
MDEINLTWKEKKGRQLQSENSHVVKTQAYITT